MKPFTRVPLAWLNLTHDRRRFLISLAGVGFAVFLMFMEVGFWFALLDSPVLVIDRLDADLVVISRARFALMVPQPFTLHRLYQALEFEGVEAVAPLYVETRASLWNNPPEPGVRPIRVLAFNAGDRVFRWPELEGQTLAIRAPDTLLFDAKSKPVYGDCRPGATLELAGRKAHVVGTVALGTDFTNDGNAVMTAENFARYFPRGRSLHDTLAEVDVGVIRLRPGANPEAVRDSLEAGLPDDVRVLTREGFRAQERHFWENATPIGQIFFLGTVLGFVVGVVICYQILASDVGDHLAEYATLKAIGYTNRYLTRVVMEEALWLSVAGFLPGLGASWLFYRLLAVATGLPMGLDGFRVVGILVLTVVMCCLSGFLALRKVRTADPAEVFG